MPRKKVSLQTSLERNPTNSLYIFILNVNFVEVQNISKLTNFIPKPNLVQTTV